MVSSVSDWSSVKDEGNKHFASKEYEAAIASYTRALSLCKADQDRCVLYKNRSACHLKLEQYEDVCRDVNSVLTVMPNDVKSMYRRCQAYEALGNLESAFKDAKRLIELEPKNKAVQDTYRKLTQEAQAKINKSQSTVGMIEEMVNCLAGESETKERKTQALSNLVIYAHKPGPSDILFKTFFPKLIVILSKNVEYSNSLMKICHGLCDKNYARLLEMLKIFSIEKIKGVMVSFNDLELVQNSLSVIVVILTSTINHFREVHKMKPEDEGKNMLVRENQALVRKVLEEQSVYTSLLNLLVQLLGAPTISAEGRDSIIDAFIKVIELHKAVSDFILANKGIKKMLDLSALSYFPIAKKDSKLPISEKTYIHVSVALSMICDKIKYFDKDKELFEEQAENVINKLINSTDEVSNMQGLIVFSTVIMASREGGQHIANKNSNVDKILVLACNEDELAKLLAVEALAHAASDKTVCNAIASTGLDIVQTLYINKNHVIRVRGLVTLCKIAMKGSGNVKDQILVDGGAEKLYKTCRKFLMSAKKDFELKKWACEGLAYLTLDADVKELLSNDTEALKSLLDLAKTADSTVTYGICNALVNLTNTYDKPEKNEELEQLAKFAKQPLPEPHKKDAEEFVQKRIRVLLENGLVTALVNLNKVVSDNTKEMVARVFCGVTDEVANRGKVVAQGGVKTLLPLALEGTEKGMDLASQALAKIGITNDPRLAFSGQRCMEVVRPFIKLLHFKKAPLLRFEGLMALTNLASLNDEIRKRIMKEKGFYEIEALMFDEDPQLQTAAVQCMCNLVLNQQAFDLFKDKESETERLKLVVLLCGEEPDDLAQAASGTLAILTADPMCCEMMVSVKSYLDILKYLLTNNKEAFRHRGLFIVANLLECSREIAVPLVEDELFDALVALKATPQPANIQMQLDRCFKAAKGWNIIQENPELK